MGSIHDDIEAVLLTEQQIQQRLDVLGRELTRAYADKELTMVPVLTGSVMFCADLLRRLPVPLRLDYLGVSSYREGCTAGELVLTKELQLDVAGYDVLVVDDILDTGQTLARIRELLLKLGARSLKFCVLLEKDIPHHGGIRADYVGFQIPNRFVVGYGLDYAERYRNLPYIGTLKPALLPRWRPGTSA